MSNLTDDEFIELITRELITCTNALNNHKGDNVRLLIFTIKLSNTLLELSEGAK